VWLIFQLQLLFALSPAQPVVLGQDPVTLPLVSLKDKAHSRRMFEAAASPEQNVVLVLKGITAETQPGVSWEVHVEPAGAAPSTPGPCLVGIISLFDHGSEPAEFVLVLDDAIAAAGKKDLQLRFVPTSGVVVEGKPQPAEVRSRVTIGKIEVAIDSALDH
jgi:hypothetical protein